MDERPGHDCDICEQNDVLPCQAVVPNPSCERLVNAQHTLAHMLPCFAWLSPRQTWRSQIHGLSPSVLPHEANVDAMSSTTFTSTSDGKTDDAGSVGESDLVDTDAHRCNEGKLRLRILELETQLRRIQMTLKTKEDELQKTNRLNTKLCRAVREKELAEARTIAYKEELSRAILDKELSEARVAAYQEELNNMQAQLEITEVQLAQVELSRDPSATKQVLLGSDLRNLEKLSVSADDPNKIDNRTDVYCDKLSSDAADIDRIGRFDCIDLADAPGDVGKDAQSISHFPFPNVNLKEQRGCTSEAGSVVDMDDVANASEQGIQVPPVWQQSCATPGKLMFDRRFTDLLHCGERFETTQPQIFKLLKQTLDNNSVTPALGCSPEKERCAVETNWQRSTTRLTNKLIISV